MTQNKQLWLAEKSLECYFCLISSVSRYQYWNLKQILGVILCFFSVGQFIIIIIMKVWIMTVRGTCGGFRFWSSLAALRPSRPCNVKPDLVHGLLPFCWQTRRNMNDWAEWSERRQTAPGPANSTAQSPDTFPPESALWAAAEEPVWVSANEEMKKAKEGDFMWSNV